MRLILTLLLTLVVTGTVAAAPPPNTLAEVLRNGVLVAGVKDGQLPFGSLDKRTGQYSGYDIDYVNAFARKLGVKVRFVPTTPTTHIGMLQRGEIDLIAACMTQTPERAKSVDFSHTYFITGQRFIARKGQFKQPLDFAGKTVGIARGTTAGDTLKKEIPSVVVKQYSGYPQALQALRRGEVVAVSTDEVLLRGLYLEMPDREEYEIPPAQISGDAFGIAVRKGDTRFLAFVNYTLMELEKSGEADLIFDKWFGPTTAYKRIKNFNRGLR